MGGRDSARVTVRVDDGIVLVAVVGELDMAGAAYFGEELLGLSAVCVGVLAVDLSACTQLGEAGASMLRAAHARARRGRCRLRVIAEHPDVVRMLDAEGIPLTAPPGEAAREPVAPQVFRAG